MQASLPTRRYCLVALLAGMAGAGCDGPPHDSPVQDVQQRLVGTWLRDYAEDGVKVRRVLVLEADGHFRETSRVTGPDAAQAEFAHAGDWLFDGTNLKRRYTSIDGRQPSAPSAPFATFEIRFPSRNEFVGIDRVRKREVAYRRVPEGTQP
jgi:hypothetical protein